MKKHYNSCKLKQLSFVPQVCLDLLSQRDEYTWKNNLLEIGAFFANKYDKDLLPVLYEKLGDNEEKNIKNHDDEPNNAAIPLINHYSKSVVICPQAEGKLNETPDTSICPQAGGEIQASFPLQELSPIFNVPWGHHKLIMDKAKGDVNKALFYIGQTLENGWNRSLLLNWMIGKFSPADIGQIGSYIVAVNHQLREEGKDNPTIGLLICRSKDNTQAQYALESSSQPIGISEYELEKFYPEKLEGVIPTIEEIEAKLNEPLTTIL